MSNSKPNIKRCACCSNIISSSCEVVKAAHAVSYVKKMGYRVEYTILSDILTPEELKIKEELKNRGFS